METDESIIANIFKSKRKEHGNLIIIAEIEQEIMVRVLMNNNPDFNRFKHMKASGAIS